MTPEQLKKRIDSVVESSGVHEKGKLVKAITELIRRIKFPDNYCDECESRMFFDSYLSSLVCDSCGYTKEKEIKVQQVRQTQIVKNDVQKLSVESVRLAVNKLKNGGNSNNDSTATAKESLPGAASKSVNWV
jgi:DNA-directed RNA polymerase subunit M/transcription elongation factor TFIIS